jgi:hypothetical protein
MSLPSIMNRVTVLPWMIDLPGLPHSPAPCCIVGHRRVRQAASSVPKSAKRLKQGSQLRPYRLRNPVQRVVAMSCKCSGLPNARSPKTSCFPIAALKRVYQKQNRRPSAQRPYPAGDRLPDLVR